MFEKAKYVTRGVNEYVPFILQMYLWELIRDMKVEKKDYLQVFRFYKINGNNCIEHSQEVPEYKKMSILNNNYFDVGELEKIYCIDDGEYSTMLFASEY